MTEYDPMADAPDEDEEPESPREHMMRMAAQQSASSYARGETAGNDPVAGTTRPAAARKAKEAMLKQYFVTVFVNEEAHINPQATVENARDHVWRRYGNAEGRFRVTRADARMAIPEGEDVELDQLRFVCDYVAAGANADDVKKRIARALDETGVSHWDMQIVQTASLRAAEPWAVPEDLPSLEELRRRMES